MGPSFTESTPHVSLSYRRVSVSGEVRENCGWLRRLKSGESEDELDELEGVGEGNRMTQASGSIATLRGISSISSSTGAGGVRPVGW